MKKLLRHLLCLVLLTAGMQAWADTEGDWTYTVENGEATVTECASTDNTLTIPSALGGYPVTTLGNGLSRFCPSVSPQYVIIPSSVTNIAGYAFYNQTSLLGVTIPTSVKEIGEYAFKGCWRMTELQLNEGLETIGNCAFNGCTALTEVVFPKTVNYIGMQVFENCTALESVTLPQHKMDYSGWCINAYIFSGAKAVKSVYALRDDPTDFNAHTYAFQASDISSDCTLYVPYGATTAYQAAGLPWTAFPNIAEVKIPHDITITSVVGGTVTASANEAEVGTVVTLTAKAEPGYYFNGYTVSSNNAVLSNGGAWTERTQTFTMPNADVTIVPAFTNNPGNLFVNLPYITDGTTTTIHIPAVPSFKLYDDGGSTAYYSPNYNGFVTLTAPEHYTMQLTGTVKTAVINGYTDYVRFWDGTSNTDDRLGDIWYKGNTDIGTLTTTGRNVTIEFGSNDTDQDDGLDLTVTLISHIVNYDLEVAGTQVTSVNKDDILGDGAVAYDPDETTLTLTGDIAYGGDYLIQNTGIDGLVISVPQNVTLSMPTNDSDSEQSLIKIGDGSSLSTTLTGAGRLTLVGNDDASNRCSAIYVTYGSTLTVKDADLYVKTCDTGLLGYTSGETLVMENSTVQISTASDGAIRDFNTITLRNCKVSVPTGGRVNNIMHCVVDAQGMVAGDVTLVPAQTHNVSFTRGTTSSIGVLPEGTTQEHGTQYTLPLNRTLYAQSMTLTAWSDGTNEYAPGSTLTLTGDITLTPVFTVNTVELSERTDNVTVRWDFSQANGAPTFALDNRYGMIVAQAEVGGETIDVAIEVDAQSSLATNGLTQNWLLASEGTQLIIRAWDYDWDRMPVQPLTVTLHTYQPLQATTTGAAITETLDGGLTRLTHDNSSQTEYITLTIAEDYAYIDYIDVLMPKPTEAGEVYFNSFCSSDPEINIEGEAPEAATVPIGGKYVVPQNRTMYAQKYDWETNETVYYTLTGWTNEATQETYAPGDTITLTEDDSYIYLSPVFRRNSVSLQTRTQKAIITWDLRRSHGAPAIEKEYANTIYVTQARIDGEIIDVKMEVDLSSDVMTNKQWTDWCHFTTNNTSLSVPAAYGATISFQTSEPVEYTTIDYTPLVPDENNTVNFTFESYSSQASIHIQDDVLFSYFTVALPGDDVPGDLNDDCDVDADDIAILADMLVGKRTKTTAADLNNSGDVTLSDLTRLVNLANE